MAFPANPLLAALTGLGVTVAILAAYLLFGLGLSRVARFLLRKNPQQWKQLRLSRFWLINTVTAPLVFALYALIIWLLGLSPTAVGFNLHHLGLSLATGIGLALLLGTPGAIVAPFAVRQGYTPMQVPFGRTLLDLIGTIAYTLLLVGPVEEILFRGIIQTILMGAMPQAAHVGPFAVLLGTVVATLLFVLYHYRNVVLGAETNAQFLRSFPGRTIISLVAALIFQGTGSLLGPILFHNLFDTLNVSSLSISMYLKRRRQPPSPIEEPTPTSAEAS